MTTTAEVTDHTRRPGEPHIAGWYGEAPAVITIDGRVVHDLSEQWTEFMHYAYLPVRLPAAELNPGDLEGGVAPIRVPQRLEFLRPFVKAAVRNAVHTVHHLDDPYVYITARRGYATPGNPLNRPGMHTDDFGGTDLNYIWSDRFPTRFLLSDRPYAISRDDETSMAEFARMAAAAERRAAGQRAGSYTVANNLRIEEGAAGALLRLTPYVIHDTPLIPAPGGMRSFVKISVSSHRYDLIGNSHNHLFDYAWPMRERAATRNQPQDLTAGDAR